MKLRVLSSGSVGNCYLFEGITSTLIVEVGVPFKQVKEALRFDLRKVAGCIITHEHKDHCKGVAELVAAGIDTYASAGTIKAMGVTSNRLRPVQPKKVFNVGEFTIYPFDVKHDCAEPLGFLIKHPECGTTLFITDSFYVPYTFKGLNNILVEANYCENIINTRLLSGRLNGFVHDRVITSHMSLQTCQQLLAANDLKAVNNIVLIHLSDTNSDAAAFKRSIEQQTGKSVYVAEKGLSINFNSTPF